MKSVFAVALVSLALIACSNGGGSSGQNGGKPVEQIQSKSVDITDRTACHGQAADGISLFSNDWTTQTLVKNGVVLDRTMHFSSTAVEVLIKATYESTSREIKVRSAISTANGKFKILDPGSDQATLPVGKDTFKFSFVSEPMLVRYSFVGPCLKINTGSEEMVLIPKEK